MSEPFRQKIQVRCPISHAFTVFTEQVDLWWPPSHRRFQGSKLQLETFTGGRFFERSEQGEEAVLGEVLNCDPPHTIRYTWHLGKITEPTQVEVSFTQTDGETIVEVVHSPGNSNMGEKWPERVALFARGWHAVFEAYTAFIETQK